jgi:hypothetical protein
MGRDATCIAAAMLLSMSDQVAETGGVQPLR